MKLLVEEIGEVVGGSLLYESGERIITGVSTDSRNVKKGDLFVALKGPNFDGHDYVREAYRRGAVACLVEDPQRGVKNQVVVHDSLKSLGDLAHYWRCQFSIPVIAVTGSNGKTTTKDMIAQVLSSKYHVLKTEGNFNNLIGLPLTLFRLDWETEVAVLEMGMNHPGEIDRLAEIASPDIGVITVVARAHLEGLGSLKKIAEAKAELLAHIPDNGVSILNADDPSTQILKKHVRSPLQTFGKSAKADFRIVESHLSDLKGVSFAIQRKGEKEKFSLPVLGDHNIMNAVAAIAVAERLDVSLDEIRKAFADFQTSAKRMELLSLPGDIRVINDCYNANPDSVIASLNFLKEAGRGRRRIAILGDMKELGKESASLHQEVGRKAAQTGVDVLYSVGNFSEDVLKGAKKYHGQSLAFSTVEEALPVIRSSLRKNDLVLIKGSRGARMERITEQLIKGRS